MSDDMRLPPGKCCADCVHFKRCSWLIAAKGTENTVRLVTFAVRARHHARRRDGEMSDGSLTQALLQEAAGLKSCAATEELVAAQWRNRPSILLGVSLTRDGNKWLALYGSNIQEGVCGFGDSPEEATRDFDKNWTTKVEERSASTDDDIPFK